VKGKVTHCDTAVGDGYAVLSDIIITKGDQKVLQLGYKKLTYYMTHAVIF